MSARKENWVVLTVDIMSMIDFEPRCVYIFFMYVDIGAFNSNKALIQTS